MKGRALTWIVICSLLLVERTEDLQKIECPGEGAQVPESWIKRSWFPSCLPSGLTACRQQDYTSHVCLCAKHVYCKPFIHDTLMIGTTCMNLQSHFIPTFAPMVIPEETSYPGRKLEIGLLERVHQCRSQPMLHGWSKARGCLGACSLYCTCLEEQVPIPATLTA